MLLDDPGPDYQLMWPRDLFRSELTAVRQQFGAASGEVELVLEEAFAGDAPREDLNRVGWRELNTAAPGWYGGADDEPNPQGFVQELLAHADRLPEYRAPRPYWSRRQGRLPEPAAAQDGPARGRREWKSIVADLQARGYLGKLAPAPCVDDRDPPTDPDLVIVEEIERRAGTLLSWPPRDIDNWTDDTFYSVVEIVHDLIARPRTRHLHSYADCGWHYSNYAYQPAHRLYRWRVNRALTAAGIDLQLAAAGEDTGRLVFSPGDARNDLLGRVAATGDLATRRTVQHAIALFRARAATREDKRSACIALAGLLEARRDLIKTELLSNDERALFEIANKFALRHRGADQCAEYDDAYLDWLFWWYLATFELTDRLTARAISGSTS